MVIDFGNGILGGKPQVFLLLQREIEAGVGKVFDGGIGVVHTLQDAGTLEIHNGPAGLVAFCIGKEKFGPAGSRYPDLGVLVNVTIGMTGDGDGFLPGGDQRMDALHHDGFPEHRAIQDRPDGSVGAGPHFFQVVFFHTGCIGGNGGAFYSHSVFFRSQGRIHRHLVIGVVPVFHAQVIVFGLQIHIGKDQDVLDHLPQDTGHFIPIHFHQRSLHLNFISHGTVSSHKQVFSQRAQANKAALFNKSIIAQRKEKEK